VSIPTFVLVAGSLNNDVLADFLAAAFLLLLLAGVLERTRLARPVPWFTGIAVLVVLGALTKRTFLPVAALALVAVAIRLRRHPRPMLAALAAVLALLGIVAATSGEARPALWHGTAVAPAARCAGGRTDRWSICLTGASYQVTQRVALARLPDVEDGDVRVHLWARGAGPGAALNMSLGTDAGSVANQTVPLDQDWRYAVVEGHVPASPHVLSLALTRVGSGSVYIDSVTLEPIDRATDSGPLPVVDADRAPPVNEIVNGSAEMATFGAPTVFPASVRRSFDTAVDSAAGLAYQPADVVASAGIIGRRATQTFASMWATIGWQGRLRLFPAGVGWALGVIVLVGLLGFGGVLLRLLLPLPASSLMLLGIVAVTTSALAQTLPPDEVLTVSGRYLLTGLVVFTTTLAVGWQHLWPGSETSLRTVVRASPFVMHVLFVAVLVVPFLANGVRL
jgi:hypothetical protein